MKRFALIILILSLCLSGIIITGCNKSQPVTDTPVTGSFQEYTSLAKNLGEQILQGKPEVLSGKLAAEMLQQISEKELLESIKQLIPPNSFVQIEDIQAKSHNGYIVTVIQANMTTSTAFLTLTFNRSKEVAGVFYNSQPRQEAPLAADEKLIKIGSEPSLDGILKGAATDTDTPLVILVAGSGPQDKDSTIQQNKPLKDLADGLAQAGITSIRYDKRTYAHPQSAAKSSTIYTEYIDDLSWLLEHIAEFSDSRRIFLLGHSQGGMIIPAVAAQHPKVKGLIILAGSPRKLADIIYDQMLAGAKDEDIAEIERVYRALKNNEGTATLPASYLKSLDEVEGDKFLRELDIPMFFLQGGKDFQVSVEKDFARYQEILQEQEKAKFKLYPDLNHLFMHSQGKDNLSEYEIKGTVSSEVIADISKFIKGDASN